MTEEKVYDALNALFRDELDNEKISLTPATTAKDIEGWDSLTNIQLVVATERKFKIRFTSMEIGGFRNVGEMVQSILSKVNN